MKVIVETLRSQVVHTDHSPIDNGFRDEAGSVSGNALVSDRLPDEQLPSCMSFCLLTQVRCRSPAIWPWSPALGSTNFGHPPPLVFSAEYCKFMKIDEHRMVQFLALGLEIPADNPDRKKYYSMNLRQRDLNSSDLAEITLMSPGDILVLYTDGVYDGSDQQARAQLEGVLCQHYRQPARDICMALLGHAVKQDDRLRENGDESLIDGKTVFIVKRT